MQNDKQQKFWLSWYAHPEIAFTLNSPWWVSGYRDDQPAICAAIKADDETGAMNFINEAHDTPCDIEWRFVEEQPEDWQPFNGRFPRASWMEW
tara:strand:- start:75 stop:353 length:279 start_codon:yes stop_codon:yes gene_type:complete